MMRDVRCRCAHRWGQRRGRPGERGDADRRRPLGRASRPPEPRGLPLDRLARPPLRATTLTHGEPTRAARALLEGVFAAVMATGIVSLLAAHGAVAGAVDKV